MYFLSFVNHVPCSIEAFLALSFSFTLCPPLFCTGSDVAQAGPHIFYVAEDGTELLILLPPPRSCGIAGLCHHARQ